MEDNRRESEITIKLGKSFMMSGVNEIRGFDEGYISLSTAYGTIGVEGEALKIESLTKENGNIYVTGNITGVFCAAERNDRKGFFKRIFG